MVTYQDLFRKLSEIRKAYNVPIRIHHLTTSDKLKKADEAFWDFKCENNLDFPFRYSEMHRIINVHKKKNYCTSVPTSVQSIEEHELLPVLINRGLVYKECPITGVSSIISNFMCEKSVIAMRTIQYLKELLDEKKIDTSVAMVIQDWICGVPLTTAVLYAQFSESFEITFASNPKKLLAECQLVLRRRSDNFLFQEFKSSIKDQYYGRQPKVFHHEKTRSEKITG